MKEKLIGISAVVLALALLLTLTPACGNGEEEVPEVTPTPVPGVTPAPGATPTPTPEAKTLKIGLLTMLSGAGAPWGIEEREGMEFARDRINDAGGIKVGADTYMVKIVPADTKMSNSVAATELTRLILDEGIHYAAGTVALEPLQPIAEKEKCFFGIIGNPRHPGPEAPHFIIGCPDPWYWVSTFWEQAYKFHPEIQTVAVVTPVDPTGGYYKQGELDAHARHGSEVVIDVEFPPYTTDYYPTLTPVVAKNPDVISLSGGARGDVDLQIKQARELGYEGLIAACARGDAASAIEIAGCEYCDGLMYNDPDYSSDLYPESIQQLDAEFREKFPGRPLCYTTYLGYAFVYFFKQAIEEANSIDPDEVMKVLDDPNWRFEWFGRVGASLGGVETTGINRCINDEVGYSELINCEKVMKSRKVVDIP